MHVSSWLGLLGTTQSLGEDAKHYLSSMNIYNNSNETLQLENSSQRGPNLL